MLYFPTCFCKHLTEGLNKMNLTSEPSFVCNCQTHALCSSCHMLPTHALMNAAGVPATIQHTALIKHSLLSNSPIYTWSSLFHRHVWLLGSNRKQRIRIVTQSYRLTHRKIRLSHQFKTIDTGASLQASQVPILDPRTPRPNRLHQQLARLLPPARCPAACRLLSWHLTEFSLKACLGPTVPMSAFKHSTLVIATLVRYFSLWPASAE